MPTMLCNVVAQELLMPSYIGCGVRANAWPDIEWRLRMVTRRERDSTYHRHSAACTGGNFMIDAASISHNFCGLHFSQGVHARDASHLPASARIAADHPEERRDGGLALEPESVQKHVRSLPRTSSAAVANIVFIRMDLFPDTIFLRKPRIPTRKLFETLCAAQTIAEVRSYATLPQVAASLLWH